MKNLARLLGFAEKPVDSNPAEDAASRSETGINDPAAAGDQSINSHEVQFIDVNKISPNPFQPRKTFNEEALQELALSIREFGVIQPLLVRSSSGGEYELVAGERRLRASKLAELVHVPVIIKDLDDKEMAELAMIENLQREDLHYLEEAEGFQQLIANFGFTQEELAKRVGKTQSTIANKLRLLKLEANVREVLVDENLTERHARALLKLNDPDLQVRVLNTIKEKNLNVRETEGLIEDILADISREMAKKDTPKQNMVKIVKDVRIFLNTINTVIGEMKKTGLKIKVKQEQDDDYITINLRIPKRRS
jgi:ParB family chromosome partitioning protein